MIPGYNTPRPNVKQYRAFEERFIRILEATGIPFSLLLYGSYARGSFIPGKSDIDGLLVLPGNVVTNKDHLSAAARAVFSAQKDNDIPLQLCVGDWQTLSDGRFNDYTSDFAEYLAVDGKLVLGKDPRSEMLCEVAKTGPHLKLAFNLRKARNALLYAPYRVEKDPEKLVRSFGDTLDNVARASTQILRLRDGSLRSERFSAVEELVRVYPLVHIGPLHDIKDLYTHLELLDQIYKDPQRMIHLMQRSTTCFEQILEAYMREFPRSEI